MVDFIDLNEHLTSLYKAGVLDVNFFTYLKLRQKSLSSPVKLDYNLYQGTSGVVDLFAVAANLWQKGLITLNPFPEVTVEFSSYPEALSEAEVLRSQDTVNPGAYLINAMQAEAARLDTSLIRVNAEFRQRWKVSTDNILRYLPGVLKKAYEGRLDSYDSNIDTTTSVVWTAAATHKPSVTSGADLKSLYSLGLSDAAYVFWILNDFMTLQSPFELNLNSLYLTWGIDSDKVLSAFSDLETAKILANYELQEIGFIWQKALSTLGTAEIEYAGALMTAEGKMMYQLWRSNNPITPSDFCALNAITPANFYKNIRRIKSKGIFNINAGVCFGNWGILYNPDSSSTQLQAPTNVVVTGVDNSKIRITWTQPGNATTWTVGYRKRGTTTAYTEKTVVTSPCVITNLLAGTEYEVYVKSVRSNVTKQSALAYGSTTGGSTGGSGNTTLSPSVPSGYSIWLKFEDAANLEANLGTYGDLAVQGDNLLSITDSTRGKVARTGEGSAFIVYNQPQPAAYTRSAWVKLEAFHSWAALFGAESGKEDSRHNLMVNDDGCVALWNNYDYLGEYGTPLTLNQWVHITATFSDGTFALYLNGVKKYTIPNINYAPDSTNSTVFVGLMGFGNAPWDNYMDDVIWYSRALTDSEVTQLYQATVK